MLPITLALEHGQAVVPLRGRQKLLVHQYKQIHRQAVVDFLHQMANFFAHLHIPQYPVGAGPGRDHTQRQGAQCTQFKPMRDLVLSARIDGGGAGDFIAKLARTVQAHQIDQIRRVEIQMGNAVLRSAQVYKHRAGLI